MTQPRTPRGVPSGGQFSGTSHAESDITLDDVPERTENSTMRNYRLEREANDRIDEVVAQYEANPEQTANHHLLLAELVDATKTARRQGLINKQMGTVPHSDEYKAAALDSIGKAGLGPLSTPENVWTNNSAHTHNNLGFHAHGKFTDVEASKLPDHLQGQLQALKDTDPDRELHIGAYADHGFPLTTDQAQFVSVALTVDEQQQVLRRLSADMPDVDWAESVQTWSRGIPECEPGTKFPTPGALRHWDAVCGAVREECPKARAALGVANDLRETAVAGYAAHTSYLGSEQWHEDQVDAELRGTPGAA